MASSTLQEVVGAPNLLELIFTSDFSRVVMEVKPELH
jgi:hypothetical protein